MKTKRHGKIIELIQENSVETQEELLKLLCHNGFDVTQATVSRDIKELRLLKTLCNNGKYRYTIANKGGFDMNNNFHTLFKNAVVNIDFASNMIVIKTLNGMAQGICAAMDSVNLEGIVGTIAGDDTIFIVTRSNNNAISLTTELKKLI